MPGGIDSRLKREELQRMKLQNAAAALQLSGPSGQLQDMQQMQQLAAGQQELERNPLILEGLQQRLRNEDLSLAADIGYRGQTDANPTDLFNALLQRMGMGQPLVGANTKGLYCVLKT